MNVTTKVRAGIATAALAVAVVASCGESRTSFDEPAARAYFAEVYPDGDLDALVRLQRDTCAKDQEFMDLWIATAGPVELGAIEAACPERLPKGNQS